MHFTILITIFKSSLLWFYGFLFRLLFWGEGLVEVIKTTSMFLLLSCVYAVIDISVKVASLLVAVC